MTLKVVIAVRFDSFDFSVGWSCSRKQSSYLALLDTEPFFFPQTLKRACLLKKNPRLHVQTRIIFWRSMDSNHMAPFTEQSLATRPSDQRFANIHKSLRMRIERQNRGYLGSMISKRLYLTH